MSAEDVIARLQREHCATVDHYGRRCACGNIPRGDCPFDSPEAEGEWYEMHADHVAAVVLDALRSNGFEVVELPEPIHRCPRDAAWMTKDEALQVDSDRRSGIALSYLDVDIPVYGPWSAVEARDLAAALLAAARHAEEGTP
ncbi:hypothetical protein [Gordonia sp. ABSL49_1]|uniref:hypothetical protein n=1 Tax=Gordonia sp. ABSL49_1 TaxID=2920941 RepID=UPI001F0F2ABE|nr:hypothetical protein [Gordonia sp. ABSL49_1]MCH5645133.1 hypothetical protein [Gordonia sp. ABSL49_1]